MERSSRHGGSRLAFAVFPVWLLLLLAGCGGGGGGGNSDGDGGPLDPPPPPVTGLTISGVAREVITDPAAATAGAAIPGAVVEVRADLDADGTYGADEVFSVLADNDGFYAVTLPETTQVPRLAIKVSATGYSDFVQTFRDLESSLSVPAALSRGDFLEVSLPDGIAAGPARMGRVVLDGDQEVTLRLYEARGAGRRTARASLARFGEAQDGGGAAGEGNPLVEVSFPLRGLRVAAASENIYANVAYLDTVSEPDTMPGGFQAEGEGNTPVSLLMTYGATDVKVYDESGNALWTDPLDRSHDIRIKVAVPPEAYASLMDEDSTTEHRVEVPLYYYDEQAEVWKAHADESGARILGWLVDSFGNELQPADLPALKDGVYAPVGADPSAVTIYTVGVVHHFTTWNSDRAGSSSSGHLKVKGKDGRTKDVAVRQRQVERKTEDRGRTKKDSDAPANVHTLRDDQIQSVLWRLLQDKPEERRRALRKLMASEDPAKIQAFAEALRKASLDERFGWAGESNEWAAGFRGLFNNRRLTDTTTDSTGLDAGGLDCTLDIGACKGLIAQAVELSLQSDSARQQVAFLMQIAVESYDVRNLNPAYALGKGFDALVMAVDNLPGNETKFSKLKEAFDNAQGIRAQLKAILALRNGTPPSWADEDYSRYRDLVWNMQDAMKDVKWWATNAGERLGMRAVKAEVPPLPATQAEAEAELAEFERDAMWEYEDVNGVLLGASQFSRYRWGYLEGGAFVETAAPAGLRGGGAVSVLEYFDGTQWLPLPGRSDTGVDASFVPVPNLLSWGNGTPDRPAVYFGEWTLDLEPNVAVTGQLVTASGDPVRNGSHLPCYVGSAVFYPDAEGRITGTIDWYTDRPVLVRLPGQAWYGVNYTVQDGKLELGNIEVREEITFDVPWSPQIDTARHTAVAVAKPAHTLSGKPLTYTAELYSATWYKTEDRAPLWQATNDTGSFTVPGDQLDQLTYYYLYVTATEPTSGTASTQWGYIRVVNQAPVVDDVELLAGATVGDVLDLGVVAHDPDSTADNDDLGQQWLEAWCNDASGNRISLRPLALQDDTGATFWRVSTKQRELYQVPGGQVTCGVRATVADRSSRTRASLEKSFTLDQKHVAPEVTRNWLGASYAQAYPVRISPSAVQFSDRNGDLASYTLDCGQGAGAVQSSTPISDVDPSTAGEQTFCYYNTPKGFDDTGAVLPYTFTYTATDSEGLSTTVTAEVVIYGPLEITVTYPAEFTPVWDEAAQADVVALPAGADRSYAIDLTIASPNGDQSVTDLSYQVTYYPADADYYGRESLGAGTLDAAAGGTVTATITKPGVYTVYATARDSVGMWASFFQTFHVTAPFDFALTQDDALREEWSPWFLSSDTLRFGAELLESPQGFSGAYRWFVDGAADPSGTAATLELSLPAGEHTVRLELGNAADPTGPTVVRGATFTIYDPVTAQVAAAFGTPAPVGLDPAADPVPLGYAFALTAGAAGVPDGVAYSVRWLVEKVEAGGTVSAQGLYVTRPSADPLTNTLVFQAEGTYRVTALVTDARGLTSAVTRDVVVQRLAPRVASLIADRTSGSPPFDVTFTADAYDPDGSLQQFSWSVTGQSPVVQTGTAASSFTRTFSAEGTYQVAVTVTDDDGLTASSNSVTVVAAYQPPTITALSASPESGLAPLDVTFAASATDPDGGDIVDFSWAVDGGSATSTGTLGSFPYTFSEPGSHTVTLTVTDSQGKTASRNVSVSVQDPNAGVVFSFRELRADGLGPLFTFPDAQSEPHAGEWFGEWATLELPGVIGPDSLLRSAHSPEKDGVQGLNGFYLPSYGSLQLFLAQVNTETTYDVGLYPMGGVASVAVELPDGYTCGNVWGNWGDPVAGPLEFYPGSGNLDREGNVSLVAEVGTLEGSVCTLTGYAHGKGTTAGFRMVAVESRAVPAPAGFALNALEVNGAGLDLEFNQNTLSRFLTDGESRVLLPVVPNVAARLVYARSDGAFSSQSLALELSPEALQGSGPLTPTFPTVTPQTVPLSNVGASGMFTTYVQQGSALLKTSVQLGAGAPSAAVATLPGGTIWAEFRAGDAQAAASAAGPADLAAGVDLATLGATAAVSDVVLTVDAGAKTATVTYTSTAAFCNLEVLLSYPDYRNLELHLLTSGAGDSVTLSTVLPAMDNPYDPSTPFLSLDAPEVASATVTCMDPVVDYDTVLNGVLGKLGNMYWYRSSFEDFIQAYRQAPQAVWQAMP